MNITKKIKKTIKKEKNERVKNLYSVKVIDFLLFCYALLSCSKGTKRIGYISYDTLEKWSCLGFKKVKEYLVEFEGKLFDIDTRWNRYGKQSLAQITLKPAFYDLLGTSPSRPRMFSKFMKSAIPETKKCKLARLLLFILARHQNLAGDTTMLDVKRLVGFVSGGDLAEIEMPNGGIRYEFEPTAFNPGTERKVQEAMLRLKNLSLVEAVKCDGVNIFNLKFDCDKIGIPDVVKKNEFDHVPSTNVLSILRIEYIKDKAKLKEIERFKNRKHKINKAKSYAATIHLEALCDNCQFKEAWEYFSKNKKIFEKIGLKQLSLLISKSLFRLLDSVMYDLKRYPVISKGKVYQNISGKAILRKAIWKHYYDHDVQELCMFGKEFLIFASENSENGVLIKWHAINWKKFVATRISSRTKRNRELLAICDDLTPQFIFENNIHYEKFIEVKERLHHIETVYYTRLIEPLRFPLMRRTSTDQYWMPKMAKNFKKEFGDVDPLKYFFQTLREVKRIDRWLYNYDVLRAERDRIMCKIMDFGMTDEFMRDMELLKNDQKMLDQKRMMIMHAENKLFLESHQSTLKESDWDEKKEDSLIKLSEKSEDKRLRSLGVDTNQIRCVEDGRVIDLADQYIDKNLDLIFSQIGEDELQF